MPRFAVVFAGLLIAKFMLASPASAVTLAIQRSEVYYKGACVTVGGSNPPGFTCPYDDVNPAFDPPIANATCDRATCGNISNDPHIEFAQDPGLAAGTGATGGGACTANKFATVDAFDQVPGTNDLNYCNNALFLCTAIIYSNELTGTVALDELRFEVFKFKDGVNPLDPGSAPPLKTFYIDNPGDGTMDLMSTGVGNSAVMPTKCVLWDGNYNIQGEEGKTNGEFGFRVRAQTQIQGDSGPITITATRAYPAGATRDHNGAIVPQKPITVDVTDIHVVRSSPTIVGQITGVTVQPYNLTYRLSKDATMFISIHNTNAPVFSLVRDIVPGVVRGGEGIPSGTRLNGDGWDGRYNNGDLGPPALYLASMTAVSVDQYGMDYPLPRIRQIGLDPLQITDIRVKPLLAGATDLAVLTYLLTEPATAFIDIYPPATQFCPGRLTSVNSDALDASPISGALPPKDFGPNLTTCGTNITPLRRIIEQKDSRKDVISFWDGRDSSGNILPDGDYVFVIYGALPSQNGFEFKGGGVAEKLIWTASAKSGFIPIIRGFVGITQVTPGTTVIGSSPPVAGLDPFTFRYTLSREAIVNIKIFDSTGVKLIKTLVTNEMRPGLFPNTERWVLPVGDNGLTISSGTYMVQMSAADPLFPAKVSTTTALFPVNLFRITDVNVTPLLNRASDVIFLDYQLSQTMNMAWNIYPPGSEVRDSTTTWPPCGVLVPSGCLQVVNPNGVAANPVISFTGLRAGRRRYTEIWDGRTAEGLFAADGDYLFTLVAESTTNPKYYPSDKIFGKVTVARGKISFDAFQVNPSVPQLYNSSNTITLHPYSIEYALSRQSSVTVQILTSNVPPAVVRTLISGQVKEAGLLIQDVWDGRDDVGNFPATGFYTVRVIAEDLASGLSSGSTAQLTISFDPLRVFDVAVAPLREDSGPAVISYQVSEPMKVSIKIYNPGTVFDLSGNPSPPEAVSLVKRIVGIRPALTEIQELWDGTDLRQSQVVDGTYKFKIVASTAAGAIDNLTGNVLDSRALSLDQPIDDIPVIRNASSDPETSFANFTYVYPNPGTEPTMNFVIYAPIQGIVTMKLFNLVGELVLDKNFGEYPADSYVNGTGAGFSWAKDNQHGRKVARGIYLAVIRLEETLGGRNILQIVKKIIVP